MKKPHAFSYHGMSRNLSKSVLNERKKEEDKKNEEKEKSKSVVMKDKKITQAMKDKKIVKLSPHDYKMYNLAKNILIQTVGETSKQLQNKKITQEEFEKLQVDGVKLANRKTNINYVFRAYTTEVYEFLLSIPGRRSKNVTILFQPMHNYMVRYGIRAHDVDGFLTVQKEVLDEFKNKTEENKQSSEH